MAKSTTAFGLVFEMLGVDKAIRRVKNLYTGVDRLSGGFEDAAENAAKLSGGLEKGKSALFGRLMKQEASRSIVQSAKAIGGLGKQMLTASGSTESLLDSFGKLIGAIPVVGPLIEGTAKVLFNMLDKFGSLVDEQTRWAQLTLDGTDGLKKMIPAISFAATEVGYTSDEFMKLSRSAGFAQDRFMELTKQTAGISYAFGVATDDAASYVKGMNAAGYSTRDVSALGDEFVDAMKKYDLKDLMQDVPEIMDMTRKSSLLLGTAMKGKVGPAVMGVAKSASIMQKVIGLTPKKALEIAKTTLGSFQELATNIAYVFTGLEDDFDPRSKRIMELFIRSGQGMRQSLSAINKAATNDMSGIAAAFEKVMEKGGRGAERMRLGMQKEFGPGFDKVLAALGPKGKQLYEKLYGPIEAGGEKLDKVGGFDKFVTEMVNGAGNLKRQTNALTEEMLSTLVKDLPETQKKMLGFFQFMKDEANKVKLVMDTTLVGKDASAAKFVEEMGNRFKPMLQDLANAIKGAIGPTFDKVTSTLSEVGGYFNSAVASFKAVAYWIRKGLSKIPGLGIMDPDEMAKNDARTALNETIGGAKTPEIRARLLAQRAAEDEADQKAKDAEKDAEDRRKQSALDNSWAGQYMRGGQRKMDVEVHVVGGRLDAIGTQKLLDARAGAESKVGPAPR